MDRRRAPRICRWCGGPVPKCRFTFCSPECVHHWRLRTDPGYLRDQVFLRDRGVCAACLVDTEALRKDKRKLDFAARRRFEKEWGRRKALWDADHIIPVAEGGGQCDLSNMRTLCLKCHRRATNALRARLAVSKHPGRGSAALLHPPHGSLPWKQEGTEMPGKKAHKPREAGDANVKGAHGKAGKGRKSAGQTTGHYERDPKGRKGQYTGAGESPLTKK